MADFTHHFWSWYIAVPTVAGLVLLFALAWRLSSRRPTDAPVETSGHVWDEDLEEYNNPLPRWWLNLLYLTILWALGYLVAYPGLGTYKGLLSWTQEGEYQQETRAAEQQYAPIFDAYAKLDLAAVAQDPKAAKIGQRLFATYCTACHGSDARGARGFPNLRDGDWLWGGDAAAIETTILHGRQAAMPAWGPILKDEGVHQVAAYVETLSGRQSDATAAAQGKALFQTNCAACHGPEGRGNPLMGAPNLTDDTWLYGGSTAKIEESIRGGRNGHMPAQQETLGPAKVHLLAAYVYGFGNGPK
mgnify:CR=1 FL=1